jgi:hemerythrin-like metal-binding protein
MDFITWNTSFSVGIQTIDREHEYLIGLINQLYRNIDLEKEPHKLLALIGSLINYTQYHFADEEEMLLTAHYPGFNEQHRAHEEFKLKIIQYRDRYESNPEEIIPEMFTFLKGWWTQHIKVQDMAFANYLKPDPGINTSGSEDR